MARILGKAVRDGERVSDNRRIRQSTAKMVGMYNFKI